MVARRVFPGTPDSQSIRWRFTSGSLCVCSFYAPHVGIPSEIRIQFWRKLAATVHRVSQLHSGTPLFLAGDSNTLFLFFQFGRLRQADAPLVPIVQEILQFHYLVISEPPDLPTHRCGAALDIILSSPSLSACVTVSCCPLAPLCCPLLSSDHILCSCGLDILQAPVSPVSAHWPLPRVRDFSTVVASCHHSLSAWHQSVLACGSGPLPDFPECAYSFTRILCGCASHHSRRRPGSSPRTRKPLWWNGACYHALVARNGSWRDFCRSEDQARFHLLRQQFHSTVRSPRTRYWNEWLGSVTSLSRRAPRLACSLIRRTFRPPVVADLCQKQWHGASCSALPPDEARSHWRAHFSSPTGDSPFSDDFFHSFSLCFASLTSLHESGRF